MWKLEISFTNEEIITFRGCEQDIPLTIAIRYYDLFVKEAGGTAIYKQNEEEIPMLLSEKILQLVN